MKINKNTFFIILLGFSFNQPLMLETELSEEQRNILLSLPADQRSNVEQKIKDQQQLKDELEETFKEYKTIIDRPEKKLLTKEEERELRDRVYGASIFASSPTTFAPSTNIPIPSDYILGPGDELVFRYYGSVTKRGQEFISRSGEIEVPLIGPINVVGLSLREAKEKISGVVEKSLIGSELSISLGAIKSIQVYVMGESYKPGAYTVSSLATVTNALYLSGGVSDLGSIRNIQVKRQGKVVGNLDLYELLIFGDTSGDLRLKPGDTVYVPVLKKTAKLDGAFRRPHRYEIKDGETVLDLINFAGGLISEAESIQKIEVYSIDKASKKRSIRTFQGYDSLEGVEAEDGVQIFAHSDYSLEPGEIELKGHVSTCVNREFLDMKY